MHKLYIDGNLAKPEWSERWQNVNDRPSIEGAALGRKLRFQRVNNPHSGCFFLNARQMAHWAKQPTFLVREATFAGPLYKPARENAAFLEVRHLDNRYLWARMKGWLTLARERPT